MRSTWRIIPVSKWLVTPMYKPFRLFGRGPTTRSLGDLLTIVINHLLNGMILQVDRSNIIWTYKPNVSTLLTPLISLLSNPWVFARKNLTINLLGASWFLLRIEEKPEKMNEFWTQSHGGGWFRWCSFQFGRFFLGSKTFMLHCRGVIFCKVPVCQSLSLHLVVPPSIEFSGKRWTLEDHSLQKVLFWKESRPLFFLICVP